MFSDKVYVNGAMVTVADVGASNVIHVTDAVVLPSAAK